MNTDEQLVAVASSAVILELMNIEVCMYSKQIPARVKVCLFESGPRYLSVVSSARLFSVVGVAL